MTPGDVALVMFPFSATEAQPYKQRPVLVLGATGAPPDEAVFVAMVTSNARRVARPRPGDVVITQWQQAGLQLPSVVRSRRLWTAEGRDVVRVIGTVESAVVDEVREQVRLLIA